MSANTAIHMVAIPAKVTPRKIALMTNASAMFCLRMLAGLPRQADERRDLAQIVVHQGDIGRLDRGVGARSGHGKTDLGPGQRRRVVDAVADHADPMALCVKALRWLAACRSAADRLGA